ncbi:sensor domain-containing protein [Ectothiorhodospira lacustris]|uniref:sensor domain-containing protein n=2 Tax=Ectothiorhodospira lacustris TaxID=2899127 RepID=UPI001EE7B301|nr:EAL domain-containing protein [Ectothiorhodospira lacustris]
MLEMETEKTRYLYEGLPATTAVSIGAAAILGLIHLPVLPALPLLGWFCLVLLVALLRGRLWLAFRRTDTPEHPVWLWRFRASTLAAGIGWGIGCTLLTQSGDLSFQAFLAFAIAGITAGAIIALATDRLSTLFLVAPMLVPLAIALLLQDGALSVMAGLIVCLFLLFVFVSASRIQASFNENIRLRVQAEAQHTTIQDNELRWRFALEGSNQGLWDWNIVTGQTYHSPRWALMLGYAPEEISPSLDAWEARLHPDDRDRVLKDLQRHLDGLAPIYESEYRLRCKDGRYLWILDQGQVISRDSQGRPTRVIGVNKDIHRRKEAERQLREERRLFATGPVMLIIWESVETGRILYASDNALDLLGYAPDELRTPGFCFDDLIHPEDRARILKEHREHMEADTTQFEQSYRLRHKSGHYRWFYDFTRPERNDTGPTGRLRGYLFDQTRIKEVEAALAKSERYNRALLEAMPDLMFRMSHDGRYLDWHAGQKSLLYKSPESFLHKNVSDVLPLEIAVRLLDAIRRVLAEDRMHFVEYTLDVSGDRRTFEARLVKLNDWEVMSVIRDVTEQKQANERIAQMAFYDALTQLPNRRMLLDRLDKAVVSGKRSGQYGALLFMDLDRFKALNDTYGHSTGDLLLQQVGQRLKTCVREMDTVARLGGDEFIVMVENLGSQEEEALKMARDIGDKIFNAMGRPYILNTLEHVATPSIGISLFSGHAVSAEEVLQQADMAMYEIKRQGRNGIRVFEPSMQSSLETRSIMVHELHQAMINRHLTLYYQPQYDHHGRIRAAEALLRWRHPRQGLISAAQVISVAEESGLMLSIGQWIMEQGFQDMKRWCEHRDWSNVVLAINLSPRQFRQPGLEAMMTEAIEKTGVDPHRIRLEVNEESLDGDMGEAIARMQRLRACGLRFSLDDFGIGKLSVGDLRRLPLDQIKVHESFLHRALDHEDDASLMRAALSLGEGLGLEVLAEGVETPEQKAFLEDLGYRAFQGYLFGRPMSWGELVGLPIASRPS